MYFSIQTTIHIYMYLIRTASIFIVQVAIIKDFKDFIYNLV